MAVMNARRWWKRNIGYQFLDTRDFGVEMRQSDIEHMFETACSLWAPHCVDFRKVDGNPDLIVRWAHLGHDSNNGNIIGANTSSFGQSVVTITFNDDVHWMATQFDKDYVNFLYAALHELGHAIGLDHSDDSSAVMYPLYSHPDLTPNWLRGLGNDDAAGAAVMYGRLPVDPNPNNPYADKVATLHNKIDTPVNFNFYITGDSIMGMDLGNGSIKPTHITYWKEIQVAWNLQRQYRVRVEGAGQRKVLDGVSPQAGLTIYRNNNGQLDIFSAPG